MNTAMAIVLDVSGSVTQTQWRLMLESYARGLSSSEVVEAIVGEGGIAICVIQFDDAAQVTMGWMQLRSRADIERFAAEFVNQERAGYLSTNTAAGMSLAIEQLMSVPAETKIMNISTDGPSNTGEPPEDVRDRAQDMEIRINCVGIITQFGNPSTWLDINVKTQDGFVVVANGWQDFQRAIKRKLVMELS